VGYHRNGRVADVNNAFNGEGPFSAERSGTLPAADLAKLCFSGKYAEKEVLKMISGQGGLVSLQGTNDMRVVLKRAHEGDKEADLDFRAFAYGIGKAIGALAAAAHGHVDGILLTGGIAYSQEVTDKIREMVEFIAPVFVYPGEGEIEALATAGFRALAGEAEIKTYA
jgi:butyrate kinase